MSPSPENEPNIQRAHGREEPPTSSSAPPRPREWSVPRERTEPRESLVRRAGGGLAFTLLVLLLIVAAGGFLWWRSYDSAGNDAARHREAPAAAQPDLTDRSFGVAVGNFDREDVAIGERDRLTDLTHLPVSVGQVSDGGAVQFQVILGSYTSQADAESMGRSLQKSSIVKDWRVVPLSQSM